MLNHSPQAFPSKFGKVFPCFSGFAPWFATLGPAFRDFRLPRCLGRGFRRQGVPGGLVHGACDFAEGPQRQGPPKSWAPGLSDLFMVYDGFMMGL